MYCERRALALTARRASRPNGRILCYHSVGQPQTGVNDVSPRQFQRHLDFALKHGYNFVSAARIAQNGGGQKDLAITFDDGWNSVFMNAAPILKDYDIPWSLFVVADWSDHHNSWSQNFVLDWRALERLIDDGVDIGSHSVTHPDFGKISATQMAEELGNSRRMIEQKLGFAPETFAIPLGQSMNWPAAAAQAAREAGYKIVYAQAENTRPKGTVARTFVTQFDGDRNFKALLGGAYDNWEEWI